MTDYEQLLADLQALRPRTATALQDAQRRRQRHLRDVLAGARLAAIEELLSYLDAVATAWKADAALIKLAFLPARLVSDFETAVEATLSGYLAVAADAMRDVMEIENLLWDFSLDSTLAQQWLTADDKTLRRQFSADAVRKRLHQAGAGRYQASAEARDYQAHSATLHVTPNAHPSPIHAKGRVPERSYESDAGFWETFQHARRVHVALERAGLALADQPATLPTGHLPAVEDAWRRTQEMQEAYLTILQAGAASRPEPPDPATA